MLRILAAAALALTATSALAQPGADSPQGAEAAGQSGAQPGGSMGAEAEGRGGGWRADPQMRAAFAHMREVCAADMQTYCSNLPQERGARRQCMSANAAKFSQPCRDAMAQMPARRRPQGDQQGDQPPPRGN